MMKEKGGAASRGHGSEFAQVVSIHGNIGDAHFQDKLLNNGRICGWLECCLISGLSDGLSDKQGDMLSDGLSG